VGRLSDLTEEKKEFQDTGCRPRTDILHVLAEIVVSKVLATATEIIIALLQT
jgi:hypothetical protein